MKVSELMALQGAIGYLREHVFNRPYPNQQDQSKSLECIDVLDRLEQEIRGAKVTVHFTTYLGVEMEIHGEREQS